MNYSRCFGVVAALAMLGGCGSEPDPAASAPTQAQAQAPAPSAQSAVPAKADPTARMARGVGDGKPGAAVELKYEFSARPEPGKPVELQVVLIPSVGVDAMAAKLSGMDGITLAGELTANFPSVQASEPYKHTVSLLADRAGVFYVTVSVDTVIGGATLARTFAIPLAAGDASVTQQKPAATPVKDATGQPVQPMKAEESTG